LAVIGLVFFLAGALDSQYSVSRWILVRAGFLSPYEVQVLVDGLIFGTFAIACIATPRVAFRYLIPARCPKCDGLSKLRVTSPVRYICQHCGFCAATENWESAR
jgi:hypothetical protein